MNHLRRSVPSLLAAALTSSLAVGSLAAQSVAIFPGDYVNVPEGPFNSPYLPLSSGTSRVQCLYETVDLAIPSGHQITRVGFREDGSTTAVESGVAMQLEIRMGWSTFDLQTMTTTFDNNYDGTPVTVFGPTLYTPPDLHDPANPLPNGQFFIDLTTPFSYVPNGRNLIVEYRIFGTANGGQQFLYRLDRADYYSPITYGPAGCQHSGGGTPNQVVQPTRPGLSWQANVTAAPANAPAFIAISPGGTLPTPYPIGSVFPGISPTCTGQLPLGNFAVLGTTTSASGGCFWSFVIPNNNVFAQIPITSQALFLDFFSPGQVVVSNGAEVQTGVRPRTAMLSRTGAPTQQMTGTKQLYYCPVAVFEHQ